MTIRIWISVPETDDIWRSKAQPRSRNLYVLRMQFNANKSPPEPMGAYPDRSRAEERVKHPVARLGRGQNAGVNQGGRKRCKMNPRRLGVYAPDASLVPLLACFRSFSDRISVVQVLLRFGQHENVFMRPGWAVFHALWHCIRLLPDDIAPQIPTTQLQRKGQPPRKPKKILGLQSSRCSWPNRHGTGGILFVWRAPRAVSACVAIAEIQPQSAI